MRLLTLDDVTLAFVTSDIWWGFYLSILGDEIFRTFERIESNPAYYTTLVYTPDCSTGNNPDINDIKNKDLPDNNDIKNKDLPGNNNIKNKDLPGNNPGNNNIKILFSKPAT